MINVILDSETQAQERYNDPPSVYFLEKFGDIGMVGIPIITTICGAAQGYTKLPLMIFIAAQIQNLAVRMLKRGFPRQRPRPYHFGKISKEDSKSFPSSHTAAAFLAFGMAKQLFGINHFSITVLALCSLVGVSRYLSKKHWPTDIATGACIGFMFGAAAAKLSM